MVCDQAVFLLNDNAHSLCAVSLPRLRVLLWGVSLVRHRWISLVIAGSWTVQGRQLEHKPLQNRFSPHRVPPRYCRRPSAGWTRILCDRQLRSSPGARQYTCIGSAKSLLDSSDMAIFGKHAPDGTPRRHAWDSTLGSERKTVIKMMLIATALATGMWASHLLAV